MNKRYRQDYETWWRERGWLYDLITGLVALIALYGLFLLAGVFK